MPINRHTQYRHLFIKFYRQNCGRFLIDAKCYSMQMRMLNIICIYLRREQDFTMSINPFAFIAKFDGVVNVTEDVMKTLIGIFNKTTTLTLIEKHRILDLLNNCSKKRSIFSMPIKSLNLMDISGTHVHLEVCRRSFLFFSLLISNSNLKRKQKTIRNNYRIIQDGCI